MMAMKDIESIGDRGREDNCRSRCGLAPPYLQFRTLHERFFGRLPATGIVPSNNMEDEAGRWRSGTGFD